MSKLPSQAEIRETVGSVGNWLVQARLTWRLLRDRRVSTWIKLIPAAAALYLVSPIDLVPDWVLPGLGQLDDLAVLLLSAKALVDLSPVEVVREHVAQLTGRRRSARPAERSDGSHAEADRPDDYVNASYRVIGADDEAARGG